MVGCGVGVHHWQVVPKHHWAFDVAQQMSGDSATFDAFVIERLHLRVKAISEHIDNTIAFERSVLCGLINAHAKRAQERLGGCGLIGESRKVPSLDAWVSERLEFGGLSVVVGDYVFRGDTCGKVTACIADESVVSVVVDVARKVAERTASAAVFGLRSSAREVWRASDVSESLVWKTLSEDEVLVIRM